MKLISIILVVLIVLIFLIWLGLQIKPKPFEVYGVKTEINDKTDLPDSLPKPVKQFYQKIYGSDYPVIKTAVVSGRQKMRIGGITFPGRFRFIYEAGHSYRHYIQLTFFGVPIMTVNEYFINGKSRLELPFGVEEGPKIDQGANLGLWAESVWLPAVLISDVRVHWKAINSETALLYVPFGERRQHFIVRFDPQNRRLQMLESMRFKGNQSKEKILWLNEVKQWGEIDGYMLPRVAALTWFDEGRPWAVFTVEEIVYNADVSDDLRAETL